MGIRHSIVAGSFYPSSEQGCVRAIRSFLEGFETPALGRPVAAAVPHAGWDYSGRLSARVFAWIKASNIPLRSVILLGADHRGGAAMPSLYSRGLWRTPLGDIEIDEDLARIIADAMPGGVVSDEEAHSEEHSIEVQIPLIQHILPGTRILPLIVPADRKASPWGSALSDALKGVSDVVVVGTSDLTHYGKGWYGFAPKGSGLEAHQWSKEENDGRIVKLLLEMQAEKVVDEAFRNRNACGAGALSATASYARARGVSKGVLLEQTTSHEVRGEGAPDQFVGYASIAYALT